MLCRYSVGWSGWRGPPATTLDEEDTMLTPATRAADFPTLREMAYLNTAAEGIGRVAVAAQPGNLSEKADSLPDGGGEDSIRRA